MSASAAYLGAALTAIDPKGRLAIPATFRNPILQSSGNDKRVYIGRNPHAPCLVGFGQSRFDELEAQLRMRERAANERGENFRTEHHGGSVFSSTFPLSFDASGRLTLPPMLLRSVGITDKAFFSGNGLDFSIWDPQTLIDHDDPLLKSQKFDASWLLEEFEGKIAGGGK